MTDIIEANRIGLVARAATCVACHAVTLRGLSAARAGYEVRVDPRPLTAAGEVAALTDGRTTWRLWRGQLDRRDAWNIPGHPPGDPDPVLASHRCGAPLPPGWLAPILARRPDPAWIEEPAW